MTKLDGCIIASQNDDAVLNALHRFGFLRTRDLAAFIWGNPKKKKRNGFEPTPLILPESAIRMAQITLARLRRSHRVNRIMAPDGSWLYGLAEAAARQLRIAGLPAKSSNDILKRVSLSHYHHRRLANEITILATLQGFNAFTEIEILSGKWFGGLTGINSKKPDAVIIDDKFIIWVEVERSRRNAKDYTKLITWLTSSWTTLNGYRNAPLKDDYELLRVLLVCDKSFVQRVISDLKLAGWDDDLIKHRIQAVPLDYVSEAKFIQTA